MSEAGVNSMVAIEGPLATADSSRIKVDTLSPGMFDKWESFVDANDQTTFCHSIAWKRAIEATWGHRAIYLSAFRDGDICGVLPMFLVRSIFGSMLVSSPNAVYGGAAASDMASATALVSRALEIARELRVRHLELRNWRSDQFVVTSPAFCENELYVSFDHPISVDEDLLMRSFPRDTRRMIRLGLKNDLQVRIGSEELLDDFFDVYAFSVRSLGTPVFPKPLFRELLRAFGGRCDILTLRHHGTLASAVLSFYFKETVAPYYAGAYPQFYKLGVNYFMYWELMRRAAERGYTRFDFGRSKRGTGAHAFKHGWGMSEHPLPYACMPIRARRVLNLTPTNSKFKLAIRAWQHLPLGVTKAIGPMIVRNLP